MYIISDRDNSKVLRNTFKGWKRKLSNYRSKADEIKKKNMDIEKFPTDSKYVKLDKGDSDEHIDVENSVTTNPSISGSNDSLCDVIPESENEYSEEEASGDDINVESFKVKCLHALKKTCLLDTIIVKLYDSGDLNDFMTFLKLLANGKLPNDNIVVQLLFERAKFQDCKNTVGMRYRKVTKLFWSIVYRLCKGVGLKFFSDEKNWGQVFRKETEKSKYSPDKSKINFAVPDKKTLYDMNHDLPKIIPPGKIRCALNLLKGKKDIVLMADGKMVTKGLQSNFCGDMDLFGHEILPNLTDLQEKLNTEMELYSKCAINYSSASDGDKFITLCEIGDSLCGMIEKIRNFHYEQRKKLKSFTSGNYPVKPDKAISACKTHMYTSSIWIRKALQLNVKLLKFMTNLQNNGHMVRTESTVHMDQITNVRLLHDADYIDQNIDRNEHPH